jgi:phosphoglycolate phosphatase-like HAD superfamily hydrolase
MFLSLQTYGSPPGKVGNLERIAALEKLDPSQIVHVGDGDNDCKAAASFGCPFVGIQITQSIPDPTKPFSAPAHKLVPDMESARAPLCDLLGLSRE